jgi:putative ABC transport system substrate-binding protein
MRRREFITLLGGAAAWPLSARAQQPDRRRVGVFIGLAEDDPDSKARLGALRQGLEKLGWSDVRFALPADEQQVTDAGEGATRAETPLRQASRSGML